MISFSSTNVSYLVSFDDGSESLVFDGQLDASADLKDHGVGEHWIADVRQMYSFTLELKRSEDIDLSLYEGSLDINGRINIRSDFCSFGSGSSLLSSTQFDRILMMLRNNNSMMKFKAKMDGFNFKQKSDDAFECKFLLKASEIKIEFTP